jgi:Na+-driven multidrug efflux pump
LPAIACAQIITFLTSNDFGAHNWESIKTNIKKITFLAAIMVSIILIGIYFWSHEILYLLDKQGEFSWLVIRVFPIVSVLVIFDLLQLILSGALRGTGNVNTVMTVRFITCFCYFMPLSYVLSHVHIEDQVLKFILVYGSFYIGNALMSLVYIRRFRSNDWQTLSI